jgi:hypothetical protein
MGLFHRSKKDMPAREKGYDEYSALGDSPDAWDDLSDEELKQVVLVKCIEYGVSQDGARIKQLFGLYQYAVERLDLSDRMKLLNQYSAMTEERKGEGHMGLMMFLVVDSSAAIQSTAAMSLAVLYEPEDGDMLSGPKFVVSSLLNQQSSSSEQGETLCGILLLGDKRLLPILEDAWSKLSDEARLGLTRARSGFVTEGMVEFWLRCLEKGCSESVYGSVVAAIAKLPGVAQAPFVLDVERLFPAYLDSEHAMRVLRKTTFGDYLLEISPRLRALEQKESEPKLIPMIFEMWKNPDKIREIVG